MDRREKNVEIFQDTEKSCKTNLRLKDAISSSLEGQYILYAYEKLNSEDMQKEQETTRVGKSAQEKSGSALQMRESVQRRDESAQNSLRSTRKAEVIVSKRRSFEAASAYKGKNVCVLNFASATNPGGGVTRGSSAQEEALCRCSTLYFNISDGKTSSQFHALHKQALRNNVMDSTYNDDCIFTPGVVVFKSDTDVPAMLPENAWYSVDVISCAAPNLRANPSNAMNPGSGSKAPKLTERQLFDLHYKRMCRILDLAKKEQEEVVILGAFGCGAFQNPPRVVAEAMAAVVKKYRFDFEIIEFAVFCSPGDTANYDVFSRRLSGI